MSAKSSGGGGNHSRDSFEEPSRLALLLSMVDGTGPEMGQPILIPALRWVAFAYRTDGINTRTFYQKGDILSCAATLARPNFFKLPSFASLFPVSPYLYPMWRVSSRDVT